MIIRKSKLRGLALALVLSSVASLGACTADDPGYMVVVADDGTPVTVDDVTGALAFIDTVHHEVHEGDAFVVSDTVAADTTTVKWQIETPNSTTYAHMVFLLSSTGEATFTVTEGSDRANGTALDEVNRRRVGSPNAATVVVTRTPTGGTTDGATQLFTYRTGAAGTGGKTVETGLSRSDTEWILKPNTKYVVAVTTYNAIYVTCELSWYEHSE